MSGVVHLRVPETCKRLIWDSAPVVPFGQETDIIDPTRRPDDWQSAGEVAGRIAERLIAHRLRMFDVHVHSKVNVARNHGRHEP